MRFSIPCETYVKLAGVAKPYPGDVRDAFLCVRIEQGIAVATNGKILAAQKIECQSPGSVHVVIDSLLIERAKAGALLDADLVIDTIDGVEWTTARIGEELFPGNAAIYPPAYLWNDWHTLAPSRAETPSAPYGFMLMETDMIAQLGESAPSRRIVFPRIIDTRIPVMVRDALDPDWFGLFMSVDSGRPNISAAKYPEWMK